MKLLLLAALAACGGGDAGSEVVDCNTWPQFTGTKCERGCAAGPTCGFNDAACKATLTTCKQPNGRIECGAESQADFDGERGCCQQDRPGELVFVECE